MRRLTLWKKRIYVLEIRRLGSDICDYCDIEFKAGCEKDKKEKDTHIRYTHTFKCNIIGFRFKKNEELEIHFLTCEIYTCSLCT